MLEAIELKDAVGGNKEFRKLIFTSEKRKLYKRIKMRIHFELLIVLGFFAKIYINWIEKYQRKGDRLKWMEKNIKKLS